MKTWYGEDGTNIFTEQGFDPDIRSLRFGGLVDLYLCYQNASMKAQTAACNTVRLGIIRRLIGNETPAADLSAPYVRHALSADSATTYNERLKYFKALMRWAYREELVENIAFLERLPKANDRTVRKKAEEKFMEGHELRRLIAGMKKDDWALLTRFLVLSGMRIGEVIALEAADVDLSSRIIHVTKTFSLVTRQLSSTKTESSERDIFIQDELLSVCRDILRRSSGLQTAAEMPQLFFCGRDGGYMHYEAYLKYFRENCRRLLGRSLSPHSLRHTHVALLAENGVPLDVISRRLGHSSSTITRNVYFHVTQKLRERDNEAVRGLQLVC